MSESPSSVRLKPTGLVVAAVGFLLTRFTVATSTRMDVALAPFLLGEIPFLVVGLGLATYGVVLTVGDDSPADVRTVTAWCLLGVAGVGLVIVLTATEGVLAGMNEPLPTTYLLRVLLGGAVGGTLTGVYAARTRHQRLASAEKADRLTVLNRLLRHEVLNKLTVIRGYAELDHAASNERIRRNADRIDTVVQQVGTLVTTPGEPPAVDLRDAVSEAVAAARARHPGATFRMRERLAGDRTGATDDGVRAYATPRLPTVLRNLLDNAVEHAGTETPTVTLEVGARDAHAWIRVADDGPGLPAEQQALLQERRLPEYDDPTAGFGLAIARLLLDEVDTRVDVDAADGTTITMTFARAIGDSGGLSTGRLLAAVGASLVAGLAMGVGFAAFTGIIPVIGALYGASNPAVGWLTHLFHSVVFGVGFAAVVSHPRVRPRLAGVGRLVVAGLGYGVFLSLFAAGVVMPVWLRLVGVPASVPTVSAIGLAGHLLWGGVLGGLFAVTRDWWVET